MRDVAAVVNVPVLVDVADVSDPVERLLGPFGIGAVVGVASKAGAEVEEAGVGNGVLLIPISEM